MFPFGTQSMRSLHRAAKRVGVDLPRRSHALPDVAVQLAVREGVGLAGVAAGGCKDQAQDVALQVDYRTP